MNRPFIQPACCWPPAMCSISLGSTGAVMPMAMVSMVTATKMKASAARRPDLTGTSAAPDASGAGKGRAS